MKFFPFLILLNGCLTSAQEVWTHRYSPSASDTLHPSSIAGKPGLYLISSFDNYPLRSTNGILWSTTSLPFADALITIGNTIFGFSNDGNAWKTTDGITAQPVILAGEPFGPRRIFPPIAASETCLIIITERGSIYRATNASGPWTPQLSPSDSLSAVVFGNGIFLASSNNGAIIKSSDGITWTPISARSGGNIKGFLNGIFFTDSGTFSADNGLSWTPAPDSFIGRGFYLSAGAGGFVAPTFSEAGVIITSQDFITWTTRPSALSAAIGPISFCGDLWIAASYDGRITTSPLASAPPIPRPTITIAPAIVLTWPNAVGRRYQLQTSPDNLTWTDSGLPHLGTGTPFQHFAPAPNTHQFYRLQTQ